MAVNLGFGGPATRTESDKSYDNNDNPAAHGIDLWAQAIYNGTNITITMPDTVNFWIHGVMVQSGSQVSLTDSTVTSNAVNSRAVQVSDANSSATLDHSALTSYNSNTIVADNGGSIQINNGSTIVNTFGGSAVAVQQGTLNMSDSTVEKTNAAHGISLVQSQGWIDDSTVKLTGTGVGGVAGIRLDGASTTLSGTGLDVQVSNGANGFYLTNSSQATLDDINVSVLGAGNSWDSNNAVLLLDSNSTVTGGNWTISLSSSDDNAVSRGLFVTNNAQATLEGTNNITVSGLNSSGIGASGNGNIVLNATGGLTNVSLLPVHAGGENGQAVFANNGTVEMHGGTITLDSQGMSPPAGTSSFMRGLSATGSTGRIDAENMAIKAIGTNTRFYGVHATDGGTVNIKDSTIDLYVLGGNTSTSVGYAINVEKDGKVIGETLEITGHSNQSAEDKIGTSWGVIGIHAMHGADIELKKSTINLTGMDSYGIRVRAWDAADTNPAVTTITLDEVQVSSKDTGILLDSNITTVHNTVDITLKNDSAIEAPTLLTIADGTAADTLTLNASDSTLTGDVINNAHYGIDLNLNLGANASLTGNVFNNAGGDLDISLDNGAILAGNINNNGAGDTQLELKNDATLTGNVINDSSGNITVSLDNATLTGLHQQHGRGRHPAQSQQQRHLERHGR
ncbi:hypothetical protein AGMMS50256_18800 [Betaproteobacteria bacterium]|nr:hypothetical protein AGMMS50256_18800 [Betaproteobacteria bacterium]